MGPRQTHNQARGWRLGASGCTSMQHRAPAIAKARNLWTREVDLPVEGHQQLHRFHLRIVRAQRPAGVHELVAQVLDGVAQNLQARPAWGAMRLRCMRLGLTSGRGIAAETGKLLSVEQEPIDQSSTRFFGPDDWMGQSTEVLSQNGAHTVMPNRCGKTSDDAHTTFGIDSPGNPPRQ